jgi:hypothetical protein
MDAAERIDAYLNELGRQLRVSRRARRRILTEVRAHLLDAAEAEQSSTADWSCAAERAVLRFGPAAETALQFNRPARQRNALFRRTLVPAIAAFALTSMATATVWAFGPGPSPARSRQVPDRVVQRHRHTARTAVPHLHNGRARARGR